MQTKNPKNSNEDNLIKNKTIENIGLKNMSKELIAERNLKKLKLKIFQQKFLHDHTFKKWTLW